MNKLRAYFRVNFAPIRSWSDISAQHFPSPPPANSVLGGPKFRAGGPKFCTDSLIYSSSKFCLVHLVTMSAMPPVDNYIPVYIFIEKPWQALDITMVGVYYVQMWKWILMIFLCDIFSGARGMLKPLCNHRQLQRPNGNKWRIVGVRCWEKKFFMVMKSIAIEFVPASRWD